MALRKKKPRRRVITAEERKRRDALTPEEQALLAAQDAAKERPDAVARTFAEDVAEAETRGIHPRAIAGSDARPSFADQFLRRGARAQEAYDYIVAHTGDGVDDEAEQWIHRYYVSRVTGLTAAFWGAVFVGVLGIVVGNSAGAATISMILSWLASFVVFAGIIVGVMITVTKRRIFPKIANILDSGRDPLTFCDYYLGFLEYKEPSEIVVAIWNYARGLRWQGRWDDARKLFEAYIDDYGMLADPKTQHLHHQLLAGIAFDLERVNDLKNELAYLRSIPVESVPQDVQAGLAVLEPLGEVLELERDGKRQEAYDLIESFFYKSQNVLRMALAIHMGQDSPNRTDALEWIGFVVKMGMSTWCVKRAKAIRSSGKLQKLPKGESRFGMNIRERRKDAKRKAREAAEVADGERMLENLPELPR